MLKHLLNINPDEPIASKILENFEKYIKGFISLPLYIPGTTYFKAVKVLIQLKLYKLIMSGLEKFINLESY
jgi:cytochrome P450 family 724 subfamily B polypeptide 1